jgi:hypothetical protein
MRSHSFCLVIVTFALCSDPQSQPRWRRDAAGGVLLKQQHDAYERAFTGTAPSVDRRRRRR